MKESLYIKNFCGITDVNIDLKQLNVFIGPQASGKSITIKVAYFCKGIFEDLQGSILNKIALNTFKKEQKDKFIRFFPKKSWGEKDSKIIYKLNDIEITIIIKNGSFKLTFSECLDEAINKTKGFYKKIYNEMKRENSHFYILKMESREKVLEFFYKKLNLDFYINNRQIFIPAGRNLFANIQSSIFSILKENNTLDPFFLEFGSFYDGLKSFSEHRDFFNKTSIIDKKIETIIHSKYKRIKNKDTLIHLDNRSVDLSSASSGQQELLPLVFILKVLLASDLSLTHEKGKLSIYIEEPEAHLFPTSQKLIINLLARLCNARGKNYQIFVTTHSPYILSSLNNLFLAGALVENPALSNKALDIIDRDEILYVENSTAYQLRNGKNTNLIDNENRIIDANYLDEISDTILNEYDKLLELKYGC